MNFKYGRKNNIDFSGREKLIRAHSQENFHGVSVQERWVHLTRQDIMPMFVGKSNENLVLSDFGRNFSMLVFYEAVYIYFTDGEYTKVFKDHRTQINY